MQSRDKLDDLLDQLEHAEEKIDKVIELVEGNLDQLIDLAEKIVTQLLS